MVKESALYRCLADVGVKELKPGRIEFNEVDIEKALECMLQDAANGLFDTLYDKDSLDKQVEFSISVELWNTRIAPDTSAPTWTRQQNDHFESFLELLWSRGDWQYDAETVLYNTDNNLVERFDPDRFYPLPISASLTEDCHQHERIAKQIESLLSLGYQPVAVDIDAHLANSQDPYLASLSLTKSQLCLPVLEDQHHYRFSYKRECKAIFSQLIPGLDITGSSVAK